MIWLLGGFHWFLDQRLESIFSFLPLTTRVRICFIKIGLSCAEFFRLLSFIWYVVLNPQLLQLGETLRNALCSFLWTIIQFLKLSVSLLFPLYFLFQRYRNSSNWFDTLIHLWVMDVANRAHNAYVLDWVTSLLSMESYRLANGFKRRIKRSIRWLRLQIFLQSLRFIGRQVF